MKSKHKHWAVLTASALGLTGLTSAANLGGEKYTYDASGNIVEKSIDGQVTKMSYDASNKVTSIASAGKSSEQISYDSAGRPVSYNDISGQQARQFSYGYADKRLKANNTGNEADFFYNAEGLLVGKAVAGETTSYAWDGNVLAAQGAETFANEEHISGGVPVIVGDQTVVVSDYLGNTLSQGNSQLASSAYGEGLEDGRFTGKPFIQELGGFVFQHRLYSPATSQWTVPDPSGYPDGENNYAYLKADPFGAIDIYGLTTKAVKYDWVYKVHSNPVASGTWNGTFVWSVAVGSESSSISSNPGWSGQNTFELSPKNGDSPAVTVTANAVTDDLTSWDYDYQKNQKQYHVLQKVYFTETTSGSSPNTIPLKTEENEAWGPWIEL